MGAGAHAHQKSARAHTVTGSALGNKLAPEKCQGTYDKIWEHTVKGVRTHRHIGCAGSQGHREEFPSTHGHSEELTVIMHSRKGAHMGTRKGAQAHMSARKWCPRTYGHQEGCLGTYGCTGNDALANMGTGMVLGHI